MCNDGALYYAYIIVGTDTDARIRKGYPLTSIRLRGFSLLHIVRETINQERGLGKNEEIFRNKICMDTSDF